MEVKYGVVGECNKLSHVDWKDCEGSKDRNCRVEDDEEEEEEEEEEDEEEE